MAPSPSKKPVDAPRDAVERVPDPDISGISHPDLTEEEVHKRARQAIRRMHRRNLEQAGREP